MNLGHRWRQAALAAFVAATVPVAGLVVGALLPKLPVLGAAGSAKVDFHALLFLLAGLVCAVGCGLAWLGRARRTAIASTATSAIAVLGAAAVFATQLTFATAHGASPTASDLLGGGGQPHTPADRTVRWATPGGTTLKAGLWLPHDHLPRPRPAVLWIHGGGFHSGVRDEQRGQFRWLADRGYPVLSVDYRLAPPARWRDASGDVLCGLSWLERHAPEYGIDPSRIVASGGSAGGALALNVAYGLRSGHLTSSCGPNPPRPPVAVAGFYPAADLAGTWQDNGVSGYTRRMADYYAGGSPGRFPDRYAYASATSRIRPGLPPTLLATGDSDHLIRSDRVRRLADRLRAAHDPVEFHLVPYGTHVYDKDFHSLGGITSRTLLHTFLTRTVPLPR